MSTYFCRSPACICEYADTIPPPRRVPPPSRVTTSDHHLTSRQSCPAACPARGRSPASRRTARSGSARAPCGRCCGCYAVKGVSVARGHKSGAHSTWGVRAVARTRTASADAKSVLTIRRNSRADAC